MSINQSASAGGLDDMCLTAIGRTSPNLTHLNISWCKNVTDEGMNSFLDRVPLLVVPHLTLRFSVYKNNCMRLFYKIRCFIRSVICK